jgi:3-dehydroquinate dehydratase/shikimate dehydrogenase
MLRLVREAKIPTVAFCMGDMGTPSRLLCGKYGSPLSYATFSEERALAPGQFSFEQMKDIYRYESIDASTEVYGVVADPVGHSLSPVIHNAGFAQAQLNKVYLPFRVPREDLGAFVASCQEWDIRGLSVTIPHKEAVIPFLTQADGAVRGIGACNTVVLDGATRSGHNTDYRAAMDSLEAAMGVSDRKDMPLKGRQALVLGAGGVGKAIVYGLLRRGVAVTVCDVDQPRAERLAEQFKCRAVEWGLRHRMQADILANATPVGMHPQVDETPYEKGYLKPSMVVFDAVYNPENTVLIKEARARGCKVVTGVDMFVRQACLQFQLFTGREGPAELMRDMIKKATGAARA